MTLTVGIWFLRGGFWVWRSISSAHSKITPLGALGAREALGGHVLGMVLPFTTASFPGGVDSSHGSMGITLMSLDKCSIDPVTLLDLEASVRSPSMAGTVRDMSGVGVQ